jgi:kumamolisin
VALVTVDQRTRRSRHRTRTLTTIALVVAAVAFGLRAGDHPAAAFVDPNQRVDFDISLRSSGDAIAVAQWLRAGGLSAATIDPAGELLHVSGAARAVDAQLGVVLVRYRAGSSEFHRPQHAPKLPPEIVKRVTAVIGLDDYSTELVHPAVGGRLLNACASRNACLTRAGVAKAFDFDPLYDRNILGSGQTVAVVLNGVVDPADLAQFNREAGINGPIDFTQVNVDSLQESDLTTAAAAESREEATMDIETVHMVAPAAKIIYYQSTFAGSGIGDAFERIAKDGKASIVTFSAGACEIGPPPPGSPRATQEAAITALKHKHVTVFTSSSDHGAYTCLQDAWSGGKTEWIVSGCYPADSANVVSVGGTYLQHTDDDSYKSEAAWVSPLTNWSTGGGVSPVDPAPPWQKGIGTSATPNRQYPDVAGPADEESGWTIVVGGKDLQSSGTSAASPFWAGYAALVRQDATQSRVGTFPFLAPVLYGVAATNRGAFHDVVRGTNLRDNAGPGWDAATGLGSMVGADLADAIVTYLRAHPGSAGSD